MKKKVSLKYGWTFQKQPIKEGQIPEHYEEDRFCEVVIPHDWLIENAENLYEDSVGWYRRTLEVDVNEQRKLFLRFEGVYMNASIYVNGQKAGEWMYGYTTFEVEITDFVRPGKNDILVKVVHQAPNSRWYTGAGIYRPVWLIYRNRVHFAADGIYIHTRKEGNGYHTEVTAEISLPEAERLSEDTVVYTIYDKEHRVVMQKQASVAEPDADLYVEHPTEWSGACPYLYELQAELFRDGELLDSECIRFGYRTIEFTSDRGFFLNGVHVKLQGVCLHHDLGCLGSAVNKDAIRRQLKLMKEMGANAIRTAHNMPAVELMELADEMGLLVMSEAFDCWKKGKTQYDYGRFFEDWAERDVANWIRRDRNHPSVILWSVGNEIYDTHADERGQETLRWLMQLVQKHDPKQNAFVTFASNFLPWINTQKCADIIKLTGYNYAEKLYEEHHREHPDWIIYGSETASVVQSRGIYHFPLAKEILADDDEQCSSLGNSITSWGAPSIEFCITKERDTEYSLGQFLWSGIDYIGEPTPYHGRNSYFGQADTAGFPKDSYYMYQAGWTSYREKPMVHIFPYWDFNPGQKIDVRVCSNAPVIELFFNHRSLGKRQLDHKHGKSITGDWQLLYEPGELYAAAYDENGNIVAEDRQVSFGDAAELCLEADKTTIAAEDEALIFITISAKDRNGVPVQNANNRVMVFVDGAGELAGLDNGDSTDTDPYCTDSKRMFGGKLLAVVRSTGAAGEIKVTVASEGMKDAVLVCRAEGERSTETLTRKRPFAKKRQDFVKIPIRKIELHPQGATLLTPENRSTELCAEVYPENADAQKLFWRVTDAAGVDSTFATVRLEKENSKKAEIEVRGDGEFYVRCMCKNGRNAVSLISMLEYRSEGLGKRNLNPYEFLSASLFSASGGAIGNGNERGISTSRDGKSWVAYENLDFGEFGSDEVTIPVFSFGETPFTFWEGIPYEKGSQIIGRKDYTLPSVWNTYLPDTFRLQKRLHGITTFAVELDRKIHMKGFQFTKREKAYSRLAAAEADSIYGDTYEKQEASIVGIGNNVTLVFEGMDFGENTAGKLVICGKTPHESNNIQLFTEWEDGRKERESLEFSYAKTDTEREFTIAPKQGRTKVSFVFLPGSAFDFAWFQFRKNVPDSES
ncbi:MAG: glycoside hydrolase family 2 TIM barrel-domain containing protein [Lachnospiraceae bacterium]